MFSVDKKLYTFFNKNSFFLGLISVIIYHFPYFLLGENTLYNIGDVLDSSLIYYTIINKLEFFFSFSNDLYIDQYHGGSVPRNALPSFFNLNSWLFFILEPSIAYPISRFFISLIGFFGMYFFIKENIIKEDNNNIFSVIISLAFAFLPHEPIMGGAIFAITPILFYSFFNLLRLKRKKISILLCFIAPLYSSAVMSTSFIWMTLFLIWLYINYRKNTFLRLPFLGLMVILLSMFLTDIHLFSINFMNDNFISHRVDRLPHSLNLIELFKWAFGLFKSEKIGHLATLHNLILYWLLIIVLIGIFKGKEFLKKPLFFTFFIFINCFLSVMIKLEYFDFLKYEYKIFSSFDFIRLVNLNAFYWWVLFALIISQILKLIDKEKKILYLILIFLLSYSGPFHVVRNSWGYRENCKRLLYNIKINNQPNNMMTMNQFYSTPLFDEIKEWIDRSSKDYRVGSIGLHPAVPAFNGFYTIDGYSNYYSMNYKLKFREIIESELYKYSSDLNKTDYWNVDKFYYWGNRCYLFSSELLSIWKHKDFIIPKESNVILNQLDFNFFKLKELGCDYLLSTVVIDKKQNPQLSFQKKFEHENFPYSIYLYSVDV